MRERTKRLKELRLKIEDSMKATRKLIRKDEVGAEDLLDMINLYDAWVSGLSVKVGEVYRHTGQLYEVIQAHTTQGDWEPQTVPALFKRVEPEGVIPEFVQPTGAHDAYKKGDKVTFKGKVYESLINANTWSPTAYPQGWKVIE